MYPPNRNNAKRASVSNRETANSRDEYNSRRVSLNLPKEYDDRIKNGMQLLRLQINSPINGKKDSPNSSQYPENVKKWKEFALVLAGSYDNIKTELINVITENDQLKAVINTLTGQNQNLRDLLFECDQQNKDLISFNDKLKKQDRDYQALYSKMEKEFGEAKAKLNNELKSRMSMQKMIEKLRKELSDVKENKIELTKESTVESYKKLADEHMKECKQLAEQLICLRSDMDNSRIQLLKTKKDSRSDFVEDSKDERIEFSKQSNMEDSSNKCSPYIWNGHSNHDNFNKKP